jgi:hypothetical protein
LRIFVECRSNTYQCASSGCIFLDVFSLAMKSGSFGSGRTLREV